MAILRKVGRSQCKAVHSERVTADRTAGATTQKLLKPRAQLPMQTVVAEPTPGFDGHGGRERRR